MYDPTGNGRDRSVDGVRFEEAEPPPHLKSVVHRYLRLDTPQTLEQDYRFHALPDACTYLVCDQQNVNVAGVTRLKASSEELNLGRSFHFVNVRFLPGVWQQNRVPVAYGQVNTAYEGHLPIAALNNSLVGQPFNVQQEVLSDFVDTLLQDGVVASNPVTERIFAHIDDIHNVGDMAQAAGLSPRQLQRVLKETTGFAPHDFLKVIRLQQSLHGEPSLSYADQSHFIHAFRRATGYTPGQYSRKFDV